MPSITGVTFPASTSSLRATRSARFCDLDGRFALLAHEHGHDREPDHAAELAAGVSSTVGEQRPVGGEGSPRRRHRVVPHVVEDEVVARSALPEVLLGVVDDMVGPDRADHVQVLRAGHAGDLGTERLGDLHGERAHASRRPVDENLLPRLDLPSSRRSWRAVVADTPTAAACSKVRLAGFSTKWSSLADAYSANAPVHHPKTSSPGRSCVTSLPTASTVPAMSVPGNLVLRLAQSRGHAHDERRARHEDPVTDVDRRRVDADQDLGVPDLGLLDVPCLQDIRRAVLLLNDRLHRWSPLLASFAHVRRLDHKLEAHVVRGHHHM